MTLRVLLISRWYPGHDEPRRGLFVADLAHALGGVETEVVVGSFQPIGPGSTAAETEAVEAAFAEVVARADALARPRNWGAPGVPVARLPILVDPDRRRPITLVDAYAAPLVPFGSALAERWPFDLIHAQAGLPDGLAAARLAARLGVPLLVTEHSSTLPDQLTDPAAVAGYREFLRPDHRVTAVSRSLARAMAGRLGVASSAIGVLPNAVATDLFTLGDPTLRDRDELLYVGSRRPTKGIETLLRAFADLHVELPQLRLRLVGDPGSPSDEERWAAVVGEFGLESSVRIEPPLDREGVASALRRAALLVHPSPRETFGTIAAEALACGTPVATPPSGGIDEIVGHTGAHGEVADGIEPALLAAAIRRLLARRSEIDPVALRTYAEETFAAGRVAARTIAAYEDLLGGRRRASARVNEGGGPAGRGGGRFVRPLVVGLERSTAAAGVAALPPELAGELTVVTTAAEAMTADRLAPVERWVEVDPEALHRERRAALGGLLDRRAGEAWWRIVVRAPLIAVRRGLIDRRRDALREESIAASVTAAWQEVAAGTRGAASPIVPLSARDVWAAGAAQAEGAPLAPGSLRWLADRWDAAGRP